MHHIILFEYYLGGGHNFSIISTKIKDILHFIIIVNLGENVTHFLKKKEIYILFLYDIT